MAAPAAAATAPAQVVQSAASTPGVAAAPPLLAPAAPAGARRARSLEQAVRATVPSATLAPFPTSRSIAPPPMRVSSGLVPAAPRFYSYTPAAMVPQPAEPRTSPAGGGSCAAAGSDTTAPAGH